MQAVPHNVLVKLVPIVLIIYLAAISLERRRSTDLLQNSLNKFGYKKCYSLVKASDRESLLNARGGKYVSIYFFGKSRRLVVDFSLYQSIRTFIEGMSVILCDFCPCIGMFDSHRLRFSSCFAHLGPRTKVTQNGFSQTIFPATCYVRLH